MKIIQLLILLFVAIYITSCAYNRVNGYNLEVYDNIYQEYIINESLTFLKIKLPPARHKIIVTETDDKYTVLFINRLRSIGYSIMELTSEEMGAYRLKENEFKLTYSIDYVFRQDRDHDNYYMSIQLFINNAVCSRIYTSPFIDELPLALGNWSIKGEFYE